MRAEARVDEDPQLAGVDHEPVDRERELAVRREEVRLEPAAVRGERRGASPRRRNSPSAELGHRPPERA